MPLPLLRDSQIPISSTLLQGDAAFGHQLSPIFCKPFLVNMGRIYSPDTKEGPSHEFLPIVISFDATKVRLLDSGYPLAPFAIWPHRN